MSKLARMSHISWLAAKRFYIEDHTYSASALAFTTLLALVPLFSVILSLVTLFPWFNTLIDSAQTYLVTNFIPASADSIQLYMQNFIRQASRLPVVGLIFLFFTATMLIITVENTLNAIWKVPERKKKFSTWLLYWIVLIIAPLVIGGSVLLSTFILSLPWLLEITWLTSLKPWIFAVISLTINTIMFSALYIIVPNVRVGVWNGLTGGFLAAILFEIAKKIFAFYILKFPSYALIYGALATIPIFLIWVYISWVIVLYGALFTHERYKFLNKTKSHLHK